jgi:tetratricopeptide (TPR) repeat protein
VIGAAAVCTVLLGFASTTPAEKPKAAVAEHSHADGPSLDQLVAESRSALNAEAKQQVALIEASIDTDRDFVKRGQMYDSLVRITGRAKQPVLSAWLSEQKAVKNNGSSSDWLAAGDRYRNSVSFQQDETKTHALYDAAIRCYNKALELEPGNLDAKVGLGICMVQTTADPMKGIGMLLEVVNEDSTHVNAQLALGDFSVQRNAPDKAIARFKTALRLRPDYYGLHLSLADLYVQTGDTAAAVSHLEEYIKVETDPLVKNDIENAIRRLRSGKQP